MNYRDNKDLLKEMEKWSGITGHHFEIGGKHRRLVVATNAGSRFITMSITPSDKRVTKNRIKDLRKVLRELGATQEQGK